MSESFDPSELLGSDVPFVDPFSFDERHFLPAFWEPALRQALTQSQPVCPDRTHQTIESQPQQPKQLRHDAHAPGLLSPDHAPACRSPTYAELARVGMPTHPVCTRVPQPRAELLNLEIETSSSDAALTVHAEVQPNCRSRKRAAEHAMKATFASDSEHDALSPDFEGQAGAAAGTVADEGTGAGEGKCTYDGARTNLHHRPGPRVRCTRTHVWGLNAIHCWQNASIFWMPRSWLQHQWLVWEQ